jgi:hypothetical protein
MYPEFLIPPDQNQVIVTIPDRENQKYKKKEA